MVAERRVELDVLVEQRFVGPLELPHQVLRTLGAIDVVADRDDEFERVAFTHARHFGCERELSAAAIPEIAQHGELERALPVRHRGGGRDCLLLRGLCALYLDGAALRLYAAAEEYACDEEGASYGCNDP